VVVIVDKEKKGNMVGVVTWGGKPIK